jgi:hypothetical protein
MIVMHFESPYETKPEMIRDKESKYRTDASRHFSSTAIPFLIPISVSACIIN